MVYEALTGAEPVPRAHARRAARAPQAPAALARRPAPRSPALARGRLRPRARDRSRGGVRAQARSPACSRPPPMRSSARAGREPRTGGAGRRSRPRRRSARGRRLHAGPRCRAPAPAGHARPAGAEPFELRRRPRWLGRRHCPLRDLRSRPRPCCARSGSRRAAPALASRSPRCSGRSRSGRPDSCCRSPAPEPRSHSRRRGRGGIRARGLRAGARRRLGRSRVVPGARGRGRLVACVRAGRRALLPALAPVLAAVFRWAALRARGGEPRTLGRQSAGRAAGPPSIALWSAVPLADGLAGTARPASSGGACRAGSECRCCCRAQPGRPGRRFCPYALGAAAARTVHGVWLAGLLAGQVALPALAGAAPEPPGRSVVAIWAVAILLALGVRAPDGDAPAGKPVPAEE